MIELKGKRVVDGVAVGNLFFLPRAGRDEARREVSDAEAEVRRFLAAADAAASDLDGLYESTRGRLGEESAQIFQIHAMMAQDGDFRDAVASVVRSELSCAEYAVRRGAEKISAMLADSGVEYIGERGADLGDVADRIVGLLRGESRGEAALPDGCVLASDDLTPSQVARLDLGKVRAIVTRAGSATSHAAILARSLGIPAVMEVGTALSENYARSTAIVDARSGRVIIDPSPSALEGFRRSLEEEERIKSELRALIGEKNETRDGVKVEIHANIGRPSDLSTALANDAGGIGLFRSEFLFLERRSEPSEEEQFEAYRTVLEGMAGKRVIVRTLDIGADKKVDYLGLPEEANPALGLRAIRICLLRPALFKSQLRALLRASVYGKLGIMFPMITSVLEIAEIKKALSEVEAELDARKIDWDRNLEIGIMVETPAAAVMSDLLAREVDFFSIGTNDLTQYTLAADRENDAVARFYDPKSEAVQRLIELAVKNAHANGSWVGVCGELGGDPSMAETFLRLGVDELSVAPPSILPLRKRIRELDLGRK